MRFEEIYHGWTERRLTQVEAAKLLGVSARTFRRYVVRYRDGGLDGLQDKRQSQPSHLRAPVDEGLRVLESYRQHHEGRSVKRFYASYRRDGGTRSYSWVKNTLQAAGAVAKRIKRRARHRHREPTAWPGMLLYQDGSRQEWAPGQQWDLIVTLDDATNEHYSMFFCTKEGTQSSFQGVREVLEAHGLLCSLYTDRASHYWHTPEAGGKVDKYRPTQFGRAMQQLGIEMIAAYTPEGRSLSECVFGWHQGRLQQELAAAGITDMATANAYLKETYMPAFNAEFAHPPQEAGSAFIPCPDQATLDDILCEQVVRNVGRDNRVRVDNLVLQLPADRYRHHSIIAKVRVSRHRDGALSIHHGPRRLARYDEQGQIIQGD